MPFLVSRLPDQTSSVPWLLRCDGAPCYRSAASKQPPLPRHTLEEPRTQQLPPWAQTLSPQLSKQDTCDPDPMLVTSCQASLWIWLSPKHWC